VPVRGQAIKTKMDHAELMTGADTDVSNTPQQQQQASISSVVNTSKNTRKVGRPSKRKHMKASKGQKVEEAGKRKATELTSSETKVMKKKKEDNQRKPHAAAGHRPVTSCTHCRQHKIKCNASERFPRPCSRCERMDLKCEIDPEFRPKKGSQIQSLRNDVKELRHKIELLTKNESLIAEALHKANSLPFNHTSFQGDSKNATVLESGTPTNGHSISGLSATSGVTGNISHMNYNLNASAPRPEVSHTHENTNNNTFSHQTTMITPINMKPLLQTIAPSEQISEFRLGEVKISFGKAKELHDRFIRDYLPYLPIMVSSNATELYHQSQLLFWTVMLTACLSDPSPTLYISLAELIKQLAIETCWIRTPRSTHIVQALLILGTWPLPNQKVLDDCSYRFIGLAKCLSMQLGLHRGKFIQEFSRTQVALQDAEKWRTRTWLAVFFCEQFWSSNLGLPPSLRADYFLEKARLDQTLPKNFRCLLSLAIFQSKLVNVMGLNVTSPDGLMEPRNRAGALSILEGELHRLAFKLQIDDNVVEIYFLYVQLMVCLFAFLPGTPSEDQIKYVQEAHSSATKIVTLASKLMEIRQLTECPIYVRHSVTTAAFILFRLQLTEYLPSKYIDSARQSVVTVHRMFRNMLAAWKDVNNDISRTATVLEKLNFVIITHPELFTEEDDIIARMRSHLTGSLFYDLVWNIHDARRRFIADQQDKKDGKYVESEEVKNAKKKAKPLPFYNQITREDFKTVTTTTPDGTTVTTLAPTDHAITNAKASATAAGLSKPSQINGIPLEMLDATGSLGGLNASKMIQQDKRHSKHKGHKTRKKKELQISSNRNVNSQIPSGQTTFSDIQTIPSITGTSMAAGVNGMVPPPLFPTNSSYTVNGEKPGTIGSSGISTGSSTSSNTPTNSFSAGRTPPTQNQNQNDMFIDSIFQQQGGNDWTENGDDFLGWFDMNMSPEF